MRLETLCSFQHAHVPDSLLWLLFLHIKTAVFYITGACLRGVSNAFDMSLWGMRRLLERVKIHRKSLMMSDVGAQSKGVYDADKDVSDETVEAVSML